MCRRPESIAVGLLFLAASVASAADVRCVDPDPATGTSRAVVVGVAPLAHTAQLLPLDKQGKLVGKGEGVRQIGQVLDNLSVALTAADSGFDRLVKLNVYITGPQGVGEVQQVFARRFRGETKPAVSFVESALPHPDALVALDAVAVARTGRDEKSVTRPHADGLYPIAGGLHVAVLPAGARVYVSGQAEKGDLAEATRRTLESLRETLNFLQRTDADVVQLKAFVTPMAEIATVRKVVAKFYEGHRLPPLVFVEWKSSLPIEIELVASAGRGEKLQPVIEYLAPPRLTPSPLYSRVARINRGPTVYVSCLYGSGATSAAQTEDIFATLGQLLPKTGSDFRHLAKATYYVATDEASEQLNKLRPNYYDPRRPPAASKAMVAGVGREGKGITLDLIAVPVPK